MWETIRRRVVDKGEERGIVKGQIALKGKGVGAGRFD